MVRSAGGVAIAVASHVAGGTTVMVTSELSDTPQVVLASYYINGGPAVVPGKQYASWKGPHAIRGVALRGELSMAGLVSKTW